jgi:hypothetical protein
MKKTSSYVTIEVIISHAEVFFILRIQTNTAELIAAG